MCRVFVLRLVVRNRLLYFSLSLSLAGQCQVRPPSRAEPASLPPSRPTPAAAKPPRPGAPAPTRRPRASQSMLDHADKGGNGGVTMDDFYRLMKKQQSNKLDDLLGDDD